MPETPALNTVSADDVLRYYVDPTANNQVTMPLQPPATPARIRREPPPGLPSLLTVRKTPQQPRSRRAQASAKQNVDDKPLKEFGQVITNILAATETLRNGHVEYGQSEDFEKFFDFIKAKLSQKPEENSEQYDQRILEHYNLLEKHADILKAIETIIDQQQQDLRAKKLTKSDHQALVELISGHLKRANPALSLQGDISGILTSIISNNSNIYTKFADIFNHLAELLTAKGIRIKYPYQQEQKDSPYDRLLSNTPEPNPNFIDKVRRFLCREGQKYLTLKLFHHYIPPVAETPTTEKPKKHTKKIIFSICASSFVTAAIVLACFIFDPAAAPFALSLAPKIHLFLQSAITFINTQISSIPFWGEIAICSTVGAGILSGITYAAKKIKNRFFSKSRNVAEEQETLNPLAPEREPGTPSSNMSSMLSAALLSAEKTPLLQAKRNLTTVFDAAATPPKKRRGCWHFFRNKRNTAPLSVIKAQKVLPTQYGTGSSQLPGQSQI